MARCLAILILAASVAVAMADSGQKQQGKGARPPYQKSAEEEENYGPPVPYEFAFAVNDDNLTNYQQRQEKSDGTTITGSYQVVDADGYLRKVIYTADAVNGFQAKVIREPTDIEVVFPEPKPETSAEKQYRTRTVPVPKQPEVVYYGRPAAPKPQPLPQYSQPQPQPQYQQPQPQPQYRQPAPQQQYHRQVLPAYEPPQPQPPRYLPAPVQPAGYGGGGGDDGQQQQVYALPQPQQQLVRVPVASRRKPYSNSGEQQQGKQQRGGYRVVTQTSEQYFDLGGSGGRPQQVYQGDDQQ